MDIVSMGSCRCEDIADREDKEDVETGNVEISTAVPDVQPAPPNVLEQARLGNLDEFRTELESGNYPLDFKAGRGQYFNRTPLHLAAMEGHEEIVEFILSRPEISREVVNVKDGFGYTPLHLAVRHSHENVVRLLTTSSWVLPDRFLAATSEPDDLGEYHGGHTPLHFAAVKGHIAIARLLLRQPCQVEFAYDPVNIFAMTWLGNTALDIARKNNFPDLEILLENSNFNWLLQERERCAMSVNAVLVGAALVVAATFATWLQPPGGIPAPDSAASVAPSPSPSASSSSPSSDRTANSRFYVFVAFAFAFSVVSLVLGILATFPSPGASLKFDLWLLRWALNLARKCLLGALVSLIFAFYFAGVVVFDKVAPKESKLVKVYHVIVNTLPSVTVGVIVVHYLLKFKMLDD